MELQVKLNLHSIHMVAQLWEDSEAFILPIEITFQNISRCQ